MVWTNDIRLGREKEGDSASMSARQGALDREERWGKAVRLDQVYNINGMEK